MRFSKTFNPSTLFRITSLTVCSCFLLTTITWSTPDIHFLFPIKEMSSVSLAQEMDLPASWGTVRERFIPDRSNAQPLIVHIQDAHANYEVQQNTRNILRYLKSKYGFDLVFLEGATDRFDPKQIQFFQDKKLAEETADLMARDGLIGGAELYLLEGLLEKDKKPMVAFGVETAGLYRKNIQDFREVLEQKETTDIFFSDFRSRLFSVGSKILNKRLQHFLKFGPLAPDAEKDLGHSLEMLKTKAQEILSFDLTDPENQFEWPQLTRYFQLQRLETEINFKDARKDSFKLIHWLQKQKELKPFIKGIKAFGVQPVPENKNPWGKKTPRKFLEEFYRAASKKEFTFKAYPDFSRMAGWMILKSEIEGTALTNEMSLLSEIMLGRLAVSPEEKNLVSIYQDAGLLRKLFLLELLPEDYRKIHSRRDDLKPSRLIERYKKLKGFIQPIEANGMDALYNRALAFYKIAKKRESRMVQKTLRNLAAQKKKKAILITGGFHSEGLFEQFRQKGMAYLEITPRISKTSGNSTYLNLMTLKGNFEALRSQVQVYGPRIPAFLGASRISRPLTDAWIIHAVKNALSVFVKTDSGDDLLARFQKAFGTSPASRAHHFEVKQVNDHLGIELSDQKGLKSFVRHPKKRHEIFTISEHRLEFQNEKFWNARAEIRADNREILNYLSQLKKETLTSQHRMRAVITVLSREIERFQNQNLGPEQKAFLMDYIHLVIFGRGLGGYLRQTARNMALWFESKNIRFPVVLLRQIAFNHKPVLHQKMALLDQLAISEQIDLNQLPMGWEEFVDEILSRYSFRTLKALWGLMAKNFDDENKFNEELLDLFNDPEEEVRQLSSEFDARDVFYETRKNLLAAAILIKASQGQARSEVRQILADVLKQNKINPDEFTEVIYPAAGNYDGVLLAKLKTEAFPDIKTYHLISLSYQWGDAAERVKSKLLEFSAQDEPAEVFTYSKDYYRADLPLSSNGKRIWIDKGPGINNLMRQEKLYQTAVEKGHLRPGDIVLTVPSGGVLPYRWQNEIAKNVKVWDDDYWDNWRVSVVTEEDFEIIKSGKFIGQLRSDLRHQEIADKFYQEVSFYYRSLAYETSRSLKAPAGDQWAHLWKERKVLHVWEKEGINVEMEKYQKLWQDPRLSEAQRAIPGRLFRHEMILQQLVEAKSLVEKLNALAPLGERDQAAKFKPLDPARYELALEIEKQLRMNYRSMHATLLGLVEEIEKELGLAGRRAEIRADKSNENREIKKQINQITFALRSLKNEKSERAEIYYFDLSGKMKELYSVDLSSLQLKQWMDAHSDDPRVQTIMQEITLTLSERYDDTRKRKVREYLQGMSVDDLNALTEENLRSQFFPNFRGKILESRWYHWKLRSGFNYDEAVKEVKALKKQKKNQRSEVRGNRKPPTEDIVLKMIPPLVEKDFESLRVDDRVVFESALRVWYRDLMETQNGAVGLDYVYIQERAGMFKGGYSNLVRRAGFVVRQAIQNGKPFDEKKIAGEVKKLLVRALSDFEDGMGRQDERYESLRQLSLHPQAVVNVLAQKYGLNKKTRSEVRNDDSEEGGNFRRGRVPLHTIVRTGLLGPLVREAVRRAGSTPVSRVQIWGKQSFTRHHTPNAPAGGELQDAPGFVEKAIAYLRTRLVDQQKATVVPVLTQLQRVQSEQMLNDVDMKAYENIFREFFESSLWKEDFLNPEGRVSVVILGDEANASRFVVWINPQKYALLSVSSEQPTMRIREGAFRKIMEDKNHGHEALAALLLRGLFRIFLREKQIVEPSSGRIEVRSRLDNFEEPGIDEEVAVEILKHLADPSGYLDQLLLGFVADEMKARERLRMNSLERFNDLKQSRPKRDKRYDVLGFSRVENEKINKWFPLYLSEIEKGIEEGKIFSYRNAASPLGMSFEFFLGFEPADLTEEAEISKEETAYFIENGGLYSLTQDLIAGLVEIESFEGERLTTAQRADFAKRLSALAKEFFVRAVSTGHIVLVHKGGRLSKLRVKDIELLGAGPRSEMRSASPRLRRTEESPTKLQRSRAEVRNHGVLVSGRDIHPDKSVRDYLQLLIQTLEKTIQPIGFEDQTVLLENPEERDSLFQKADAVFKDPFISKVIKEILDEISNPKWKNYSPEIARIRLGRMIERLNQKTGLKGYVIGFREEEELDSAKDQKTYQVYQVDAALPQEIRGIPFLAWLLRDKASALTADFVTQVSTSGILKDAENIYKKIQKKPDSFEAKFYLKDFPKAAQSDPEAKDEFIQDFAWNILEHTLLEEVLHRMHDLLRFQRFEIREVKSAMEEERMAKMGTVALSSLPFFALGFSVLHSSHRKDIQKLFSTGFLGELSVSPSNIGRFYPFVEIAARLGEKSAKAFVRRVQQSVENEEGDLDDGVLHLGQTGSKFRIPVGRIAEHLISIKSRVVQDTAASLYEKRTGLNPIDLGSLSQLADQIQALKALGIKFGKDGFEFTNPAPLRSEIRERNVFDGKGESKKEIYVRGSGVSGDRYSQPAKFLRPSQSRLPALHITSIFLPLFFSLRLFFEKINDKDQNNQNDPTNRQNTSIKGLTSQGEGDDDSRQINGKSTHQKLSQVFSPFMRQLPFHEIPLINNSYLTYKILYLIILDNSFFVKTSRLLLFSPRAEMRSEDDEVGDDLSHDWEWMKKWVVARIVILAGSLAIGYLILNGIVSIEKKPAPPTPIKTPAPDRGPPGPLNDLREPVFVQNQNSLHVLVPIPEELASKKADRIQFEKEAAALIEKFSDPKIDFMEREKAWQQITAIDRREIPILIGHAARQKDEEEIKKLRDFHWKLLESSEEGLKAVGRSLAQYDELLKGVQGDRQKMLEIEKKRLAELKFGFAILEQEIYRSWGDFAAWSVRVKKERDHLIQNFPAYVAYFDIAHRYFFRNPAEKDLIVAERAKQILKAIEAKEPLPGREKFITDFLGQVLKRFEEIKNEKKSRSEMREKSGYESGVKGEDPSLISRKSRSESEKESRTISHLRLGNSWSKSLSRSKPLVKIKNNNIIVYNAYSSWKAMIQVAAVAEKIVDPSGLMPSGVRKVKKTFGFYRTGTMKFVSENSPTGLLQTKQVLSIDLRDLLGLKETVSGNAWVLNLKEEEVKGNPEFVSVLSQRLDEDAHIFIHGEARLPDDITPLKLLLKSFHSDQVHFVSNKEELVRGMQRVDPKANANRLGLTHSEAESWSELFASLKGITLKLEMDDRVRSQGYDEKKMMIASIPLLVLLKQVPGDKLAGVLNRLGLTFGPRSEIRVGFSYLAALDRLMAQKQGKEISLQSA